MGVNKTLLLITSGLMVVVFGIFILWQDHEMKFYKEPSAEVKIVRSWELPNELDEVSGIAYFGEDKIAAVQDEDGIIYIYDLKSSKIEEEIDFAGSGDYEGIAIDGETAYVLKSDGDIYIVANFMENPKVRKVSYPHRSDYNFEGLFLDREYNRLLLAVKDGDGDAEGYKAIYAVSLGSMKFQEEPAYKLTFEEELFDEIRKEKAKKTFFPSEINRNPVTGELMLLEAEDPRILILDPSGKAKALYHLDEDDFPQPEGLTFNGNNIYISNEGNPASIHQVIIK
jgi:uncharacterized protein YjiK